MADIAGARLIAAVQGYAASLLEPHSGAPLCIWPNVNSPALALAKGFTPMDRRASEPSRLRLNEDRTPATQQGRAVQRPSNVVHWATAAWTWHRRCWSSSIMMRTPRIQPKTGLR